MIVSRTIATLAALVGLLAYVQAHVALTFPPARKYDLDFLDNSRTKGPCGMPKGKLHYSLVCLLVFFFFKVLDLRLLRTVLGLVRR